MTNEGQKSAPTPAGEQNEMWTGRAISLFEALEGTGIEPTSATVLDEMIAVEDRYPAVAAFLNTLPGRSNGNRAKAEEHLEYCTMQLRPTKP